MSIHTSSLKTIILKAFQWFLVLAFWTALLCVFLLMYEASHFGHTSGALLADPYTFSSRLSGGPAGQSGPLQHVYYLKNHKTGSTSIYFILAEYCRSRNLLALLPSGVHINLRPPLHPSQLLLLPRVEKYDMVFNHHVYTPRMFKHLHNDTFKFTTVREPLSQFVSAFYYFRTEGMKYLADIPEPDPLSEFLSHPQKYEAKGYASFTNNRQSVDLGFSLSHSFNDSQYIKAFIAQCERNFDLILITDYFDESIVLLKRILRWQTQDVIYFKKLSRLNGSAAQHLTDVQRGQHRGFATADTALYSHFLAKFKNRISLERDLLGEVQEFKDILKKVYNFCETRNSTIKQLLVPAGRWSDRINIPHSKCQWFKLSETVFTKHLQRVQKELLAT